MKKILAVDDNEEILELVEYILSSNNFDVRKHATGLGLREIVIDYKPDLILLDAILPGRSGTDVCKELKNEFDIPVILFSASIQKTKAYKECDADDFINKPFDIDEFVRKIILHLNKKFTGKI